MRASIVNGGTTNGLAEAGDKITFTFSKAIDPNSILSGWSGSATNVVVRLNNGTGFVASLPEPGLVDNGLIGARLRFDYRWQLRR